MPNEEEVRNQCQKYLVSLQEYEKKDPQFKVYLDTKIGTIINTSRDLDYSKTLTDPYDIANQYFTRPEHGRSTAVCSLVNNKGDSISPPAPKKE
uniref:hypothetical protein n=1 Tax=Bacillus thuringiensis TaxID=1428 RepID=UPI003B982916